MHLEALYYVNWFVKISHLTNRYSSMAMIPPFMFCIFPPCWLLPQGGFRYRELEEEGHGQEG